MLNEKAMLEIKQLKANGTPNLELMEKYKLGYAELREVLDK